MFPNGFAYINVPFHFCFNFGHAAESRDIQTHIDIQTGLNFLVEVALERLPFLKLLLMTTVATKDVHFPG